MHSIFKAVVAGLVFGPIVANAYTVGSYFDVNNQSGSAVYANGTTVVNGVDLLVDHFEDDAPAFHSKDYTHVIAIYAADTNKLLCKVTEKEEVEWAFGDTVDWLKATSDNAACKVTPSISGEGDQTSHVTTKIG